MAVFQAGSASVPIVPDFRDAQKAIGAWFASQGSLHIGVKPDLNNADLARTQAELDSLHGDAKVSIDGNYLQKSIESALAVSGLDRLSSALSAVISPAVITAVTGAATELVAAASQAAGALALIPAGLAAIAVPAATVAIGIHGVGDAFKALDTGNLQKIQQAMAELAPSAQAFVTQVHALAPAWTALRLDVQQQLFTGVGSAVTSLAQVALPILRTGLVDVAGALNSGLLTAMATLRTEGGNFTTLFSNIAASTRIATGAATPLIQAFLTLASVGSQFLPQLAAGFVTVAARFNDWVQHMAATGQLVTLIQNAINVLDQLGRLAINVGSILGGIFTAAVGPGGILLGLLVHLTGQLATFVHSADGQSALQSFFVSIQVALGTLLPALGVLVQAIVTAVLPAIGQFAALLAPIAGQLLVQLASVLLQVGQILPPVAQVMAALVSAMAPLIPVIGQIITTLLPPLVQLAGQLAPIIAQLSSIIGQALLSALRVVAPILPQLGDAFIKILSALLPLIQPLLQIAIQLLPPLLNVVSALIPVVTGLVGVFAPLLQTLIKIVDATVLPALVFLVNGFAAGLKFLAGFLGPLAPVLQGIAIAVGVWTAAQWLLNIALDANPIGLVILAIAGLVTAIGLIVTHLQFFRDIFTAVVDWVVQHWQLVVAAIPGIGPVILAVILLVQNFQAIWTTVLGAIQGAWSAFWSFIQSVGTTSWGAVSGFFTGAWAALSAAWTATWTAVLAFFQQIWTTLSGWAQAAWNALQAFWSAVWSAFSQAWTNFWNAVFSFFQQLWTTLSGWAQAAWNALQAFWSAGWNAFSQAWTNFWNTVFSFFQQLWTTLSGWAQAAWNALQAFWSAAWNAFSQAWTNFWNAVFSFFQQLWTTLSGWAQATWNALSSFFQNGLNNFFAFWQNIWNSISSFFQNIWNVISSVGQSIWNALSSYFTNSLNAFQGVWSAVWNGVSGTFQTVWNGIKGFAQQVWNDIKAIIATPINFVIGTILNDGLFKAWNAVNDFLHLPFHIANLPTIPGFYTGGYTGEAGMFGTDGPGDPAGVVHAKEFVFTANQVANAGGPSAMYGLASHLDNNYAQGGLVRNQTSDPQVGINSYVVPPSIAPRIARFLDALSVGQAEAVQAAGGFGALGPGFFWGGYADPVIAGKAFAQAQNGKPYIWGGVGPAGYDCSGFQSAITNVLRGAANPYSRVGSTANFPWAGFTPGLTSIYGIGSTKDAGGGIGHMAGTLGGINAEAGGSHGNVAFGGPAAGALASLFNIHASLPQVGGTFTGGGGGGGGGGVLSILGNVISGVGDVFTMLQNSITGPISQLTSQKEGGSWLSILAGVPTKLLDGLWSVVKDAVGSAVSAAVSAVNPANPAFDVSTTGSIQSQVQSAAHAFHPGWETGAEWSGIDYIVSHESGWNPKAQNPTSSASGLFQEIDSTWAAYRPPNAGQYTHAKDAPVADQAMGGLNYISSRYGDPIAAQAFWASHHFYDQGGFLPPGWSNVYNGTGQHEMVLNPQQQANLSALTGAGGTGGAGMPVWHFYLGDKEITDLVDVRYSQLSSRDGRTFRSSR